MTQWRASKRLYGPLPMALMTVAMMFMALAPAGAAVLGDINADNRVDLREAVYALRVSAGLQPEIVVGAADMEDAVNAFSMAMGEIGQYDDDLQALTLAINTLGLDDALATQRRAVLADVITYLQNGDNFSCGTIQTTGLTTKTIVFTFMGEPACAGLFGKASITPSKEGEAIVFTIVYDNLANDACAINGAAATTLDLTEIASGKITATHAFSDGMTICGQSISGGVAIAYDAQGKVLSVSSERAYAVGGVEKTVAMNYTYNADTGFSGAATVKSGDETTAMAFENIKLDPTCGIPTSGTLVVSNVTFDFSQTTCENPMVAVTINGVTVELSLDAAKTYLMTLYK